MTDTTSPGTSFGEALAQLAADKPDAPALTCAGRTLSWSDLELRSNRLARAYAAAGVGHGDFVCIVLDNSVDYHVVAFAVWKLGATPQPLSGKMTAKELTAVLDVVKPAGIVGTTQDGFATLPTTVDSGDESPLPPAFAPAWKAPASGGSTGTPKVIVAEAPAVVEGLVPFAGLVGMPAGGTALVPGPLYHNAPFMFSSIALLGGFHVVLEQRFDAEQVLKDITRYRATWMYAVPTMMQRIWRLDPEVRDSYDLRSLQCLVHMAAPCPPWLKREWINWLGPQKVLEIYAATEGMAATRIDGVEWLQHPGSVGRAVVGEIKVLDDSGAELPPGEVGHVWLRGGGDVQAGYHYLGATAKEIDGGWQCVGDLGYFNEEGYLFLTDRDSDMILVGGANVYPAELEAALDEHPRVLTSCVIGVPHVDLGAVPHAIVQTADGREVEDLVPFLRDRLSKYKLPRTFEFTSTPLRDDAGKVRRSALQAERAARR